MSDTSEPTPSEPTPTPTNQTKRWGFVVAILVTAFTVALVVVGWVVFRNFRQNSPLPVPIPGTPSFSGSSGQLHDTVFVPTQDTPLTAQKSAIWCGALPLAWHRFEKEIVKEKLILKGAEELSRRLSNAPEPELNAEHYYTAAGLGRDGIFERIKSDMAKFPKAHVPDAPSDGTNHAIAYTYLQAAVSYKFAFKDKLKPLLFKDSKGKQTAVHAFGIREEDKERGGGTYRSQVRVLFRKDNEFAVDLCHDSSPYQIVLARIKRKGTLKATLDELQKQTVGGRHKPLNEVAVLLVPNMHWKVTHRFRELEDKPIVSTSLPAGRNMYRVLQFVEFKMDRKGASVAAGAQLGGWANGHPPDAYIFDRPFLIVLRKRGSNSPFFVMWVDNAELLQPFAPRFQP